MTAIPLDTATEDALTSGLLTRRVLAWIVDAVLISAILLGVWLVLAAFTVLTLGFGAPLFAILAFVPGVYGWLFLVSPLQASPGQALLGLAVARDADLGTPTALQALVYIVGYIVTMGFGAIWVAVALVTARHRTLHDIVSGLVVARRSTLAQIRHQASLTGSEMSWNNSAWSAGGRPIA